MPTTIISSFPTFKNQVPETPHILDVAEMFCDTIQGEGVTTGVPAIFLRLQGCLLRCHFCFHENTRIVTKLRGTIKIKDVKVGDILITLDEKENIVETTVENLHQTTRDVVDLLGIRFTKDVTDAPVVCTKEHPFFVKNRGWVEAEKLKVGDTILGLTSKQSVSYRSTTNNNQFKKINIEKRQKTQKEMREKGLIKPYKRTQYHRDNLSRLRTGENNPMKRSEVAKKNAESHSFKKSRLESAYEELFQHLKLDIQFIGITNKKAIGSKEKRYRFPDFLVNDTKKLIEVYDTTYEYEVLVDGKYTRQRRGVEWREKTISHYQEFGYEVLFLNELELRDKDKLQDKLFNYVYNGDTILEIHSEFSDKQKARLFGSVKQTTCEVFNLECQPYNTYHVQGKHHNKLVHNCDSLEVWMQGNPYTFEQLFQICEEQGVIERLRNGHHLVITGGSPIKQSKQLTAFLFDFYMRYKFKPYVEVENESVQSPEHLSMYVDQWNNSPKLANSGMKANIRIKPEVLKELNSFENSWFKFVVDSDEDWEEIERDFLPYIDKKRVILMPKGQTQEELLLTREKVVNLAVKNNVRFCDREHVNIWNKKTGV